jgi:hypothetical protein
MTSSKCFGSKCEFLFYNSKTIITICDLIQKIHFPDYDYVVLSFLPYLTHIITIFTHYSKGERKAQLRKTTTPKSKENW